MKEINASDIKMLVQYYSALGFDRLPINISGTICKNNVCLAKEQALRSLGEEVGDCTRCRLSEKRIKIVFGEGNPGTSLMCVGEAPGEEEDSQGRPFVGRAGQLLTRLINKMGFGREEVYITNTVKCRPPNNRKPLEDEINTCMPFLQKQIEIISPKVVITLGDVATKALIGAVGNISKVRGKVFRYKETKVVPTFHPSYLLRNPRQKWLTWDDAQVALRILGEKRNKN